MKGKDYNKFPSTYNEKKNPASSVDRIDLLKLARIARCYDYTCSFCFKTFPSAQALGGHQNAHKSERMEEKKLYVKDPIGYRRRLFLQSAKYLKFAANSGGVKPKYSNGGESSSMAGNGLGHRAGRVNEKSHSLIDLNLFPQREIVGGKACMEVAAMADNANVVAFNGVKDGNGIKYEKLDLTLKL